MAKKILFKTWPTIIFPNRQRFLIIMVLTPFHVNIHLLQLQVEVDYQARRKTEKAAGARSSESGGIRSASASYTDDDLKSRLCSRDRK